jgi:hypothetical protein
MHGPPRALEATSRLTTQTQRPWAAMEHRPPFTPCDVMRHDIWRRISRGPCRGHHPPPYGPRLRHRPAAPCPALCLWVFIPSPGSSDGWRRAWRWDGSQRHTRLSMCRVSCPLGYALPLPLTRACGGPSRFRACRTDALWTPGRRRVHPDSGRHSLLRGRSPASAF